MNRLASLPQRLLLRSAASAALAAGLLLPLQAATTTPIDNFNDGGHWSGTGCQSGTCNFETMDGQLRISGTSMTPNKLADVWYYKAYPIHSDQTLELRVDRITASDELVAGGIGFEVEGGPNNRGYAFYCTQNRAVLAKYGPHGAAFFFDEAVTPSTEPVVLKLALTQVEDGLQLTTTVVEMDAPHAVLFKRTLVDTEARDPVVGGNASDPGSPYIGTSYDVWLGVLDSADVQRDYVELVYDNFEYSYLPILDVPQKAVCLSWPLTEGEFVVESAATIDGPWEEVTSGATSVDGDRQQVWVLAEDQVGYFRLRAREVKTP